MTDQPSPVPAPPPMRASDHDREQVAALLQKAMSEGRISVAELEERLDSVYAAKTLAALEPIVRDLPGHTLSLYKSVPTPVPTAASLTVTGHDSPTANLVAILSGVQRKGTWTAPTHINVVAIMGGVELDFTRAALSGMETVINVTAIMGGVEISVPEGLTVRVDGVGIMGAFEDTVHQHYGPEAPVLHVKGAAIMGGVEVRRRKKAIGS